MNKGVLSISVIGGILFLVGLGSYLGIVDGGFFGPSIFALIAVSILLFVIGADDKGKEKWLELSLASATLFGVSVLNYFSFGGPLAPVSVILFAFFIWKWASISQNKPST